MTTAAAHSVRNACVKPSHRLKLTKRVMQRPISSMQLSEQQNMKIRNGW